MLDSDLYLGSTSLKISNLIYVLSKIALLQIRPMAHTTNGSLMKLTYIGCNGLARSAGSTLIVKAPLQSIENISIPRLTSRFQCCLTCVRDQQTKAVWGRARYASVK